MQRQMGPVFLGKFARRDIKAGRQDTYGLVIFVEERWLVALKNELDAITDKFFYLKNIQINEIIIFFANKA